MALSELTVFLVLHTLMAAALAVAAAWWWRVTAGWLVATLAVALAALATAACAWANPGQNALIHAVNVTAFARPEQLAFVTGIASGVLSGLALAAFGQQPLARMAVVSTYSSVVLLFCVMALKDVISPLLAQPGDVAAAGLVQREAAEGFRVEPFAQLTISPTSLAAGPDGKIYVAGLSGVAFQNGQVVRLDAGERGVTELVVAKYLNRPHGIAFHNGELFISRAGQFNRAVDGMVRQANTGMITRGRDLDGNGVYEYFDDVLTDLPGARMPDGLHQNNGIAFDSQGRLYVTVGSDADHGPPLHDWGGTIVRCGADGSGPMVFARGLRNPFDLAFGPGGELFCTDNDANESNPGDKLNWVREGDHFGFPFDAQAAAVEVVGAQTPLLRGRSLEGVAYAPPGSLPKGYDDCLYVAAYADNQINRIRLRREGDSWQSEVDLFARVPRAIDVIVHDGAVYCASHEKQVVVRIVPE